MFRRLFYAAACVSALLLLATLIVWPVSYYGRDYARYVTTGGDEYVVAADSGRAVVARNSGWHDTPGWYFRATDPVWSLWSYLTWNTPDPDSSFTAPTFLGVSWLDPTLDGPSETTVFIPFSYLAILFSILPLLAFRSIRRQRRLARVGHCSKCGYNLCAHKPGDKCPECGTPVAERVP